MKKILEKKWVRWMLIALLVLTAGIASVTVTRMLAVTDTLPLKNIVDSYKDLLPNDAENDKDVNNDWYEEPSEKNELDLNPGGYASGEVGDDEWLGQPEDNHNYMDRFYPPAWEREDYDALYPSYWPEKHPQPEWPKYPDREIPAEHPGMVGDEPELPSGEKPTKPSPPSVKPEAPEIETPEGMPPPPFEEKPETESGQYPGVPQDPPPEEENGGGDSSLEQLEPDDDIGKTYRTRRFIFKIDAVKRVSRYADYTAAEGSELIDVTITKKNIFGKPILLESNDFRIVSDSLSAPRYPFAAKDESMMPSAFKIDDEKQATYHLIYEVPAALADLTLVYSEQGITPGEMDTFNVRLTQGKP